MIGPNKYLLGALGVVCVTIALLWWRLDAVSEQRDKARAVAEASAATIAALQAEAARTEAILSDLRGIQDQIREDSARTRRALANVEASNAEVRSLLDTRLPDDLAGVLWPDGEDGNASPDSAGRSDQALQGERP